MAVNADLEDALRALASDKRLLILEWLKEARSHFPRTTTFSVDLPEGYKQQGTTFDHFGIMNMMKPGGRMTIYFDDLQYIGRSQDFSADPNWDAAGNRKSYETAEVGGAQNFGFSATHFAPGYGINGTTPDRATSFSGFRHSGSEARFRHH